MQTLTITRPDDWHVHLRDGTALPATVSHTARYFQRAIVMPNLVPPVTTTELALQYAHRINAHLPASSTFQPLMVLYLTDNTAPEEIAKAKASGQVVAVKLYPAGATTNSDHGMTDLNKVTGVLEALSAAQMPLLVHGEVTTADVDIFDREKRFIDNQLNTIVNRFPDLKVVLEHITTKEAVEFVAACGTNIAATITPQHLMYNRNHMLVGGIKPHMYCLPVLKRNIHQQALRDAVATGSAKYFLGTDSAPHARHTKENACGCAGCFSAHAALELYAEVFEELGILEHLEGFASFHGPDFYNLPRNQDTVTLIKEAWQVPEHYDFADQTIVPLKAGADIGWKVVSN